MEIIKFSFFTDPPIDFEYKKYKILSYTVASDQKYVELEFSPWLLNNKLLLLDVKNFLENLDKTKNSLTKKYVRFKGENIFYKTDYPKRIESLETIEKTMLFSLPIIERSNDFGEDLANSSGAILY